MKKNFKVEAAFTLIELIVVMMIIAVLASVLLVNFQAARLRTRDVSRKSDLRQIKSALQIYYNDYQVFPASNGSGEILGCGNTGTSRCSWNGSFSANGTDYMTHLPIDPLNTGNKVFMYRQISGDSYILYTELENASDDDIVKSQQRCDPTNAQGLGGASSTYYLVCQD